MAEALKAMYNKEFLQSFGEKVHAVYDTFDIESFVATTMDEAWDGLALMARMRRITQTLRVYLPIQYVEALDVLFAIDETCIGFPYLFFPDFVATYGQEEEHWELSMKALERFTQKSSSEFAIRAFLLRDPERVMAQMAIWSKHQNEYVRRLASEGCRPRLPWGVGLPIFKRDPTPVISILEQLKADSSLYVRKSVANNLNDITKDHPSVVLETIRRWKDVDPHTDWIVRQGCRTLIRKANPEAMELFGYAKSTDDASLTTGASLSALPSSLAIGEICELQYELNIREGTPVHLRIEYGIDFMKARGHTSRKAFLLSDKTVTGGTRLTGTRKHNWSNLTTRHHYPGDHRIALLVNGREVANAVLKLRLND
ncbi:MAG TPA: hypothetical protein DD730_02565 [Desulfosporosinus sp.]|jgi:3-methyladenine DNA glycosylase AlkC|nr:hypothetical protein [Desulfosporosinus sp.]